MCVTMIAGLSCLWLLQLTTACSLAIRSYHNIVLTTHSSVLRYTALICWYSQRCLWCSHSHHL